MTTKVVYLNGNSLILDGSQESPLENNVKGFMGTIFDKGIDGARIIPMAVGEGVPPRDIISLDANRPAVTGEQIGSNWIQSVTWKPPERKG